MKWHRKSDYMSAALLMNGLSLACTTVAHGQQQQDGTMLLEEVVITARAREEALQDVPISVATVSGTLLEGSGIINLEQLASGIPNFAVTQDPIGDKINIRGIFTSEVASLEQSVSTFLDGVNRGRGTQSRFAFLDLERVEVLRGPQGTLFGKNTVGGALNLTSRKPTGTFGANLNAAYEPELEETTFGGFVNGPLSETLRGRVAFSSSDQEKGYIDNRFYNNDTPLQKNMLGRVTLQQDITDRAVLTIRGEYGDFEVDGQPFALKSVGPLAPALQTFGVPGGSVTETAIGQLTPGVLDFGSNGIMEGDNQEVAVTFEQKFASGGSLEIIAAYSALDFQRRLDADFSPIDLLGFDDTEDYDQTSLSIRYLSSDEGKFRYVAGLYFQQADLSLTGFTSLNVPAGQAFFGPMCQAAGLSAADSTQLFLAASGQAPASSAATQLATAGNAAVVNACTTLGASQVFPTSLSRSNSLDQDGDTLAGYFQADFDLTSKLEVALGVRYTLEDKDARQVVFGSSFGSMQPNPALDVPLGLFLEATPHDFGRDVLDRKENKFDLSGTLQYKFTESVNAYLSASSGFKAGGFNSISFSADPANAEFDEEEVKSYELGLKTILADGTVQFNAALFFTQIEDLQVGQFTGDTSFIVQNAAEAETQGVEIDARVRLTKNLGFSLAAAYTDFEFTSFPRAGCTVQQLLALRQGAFDQGAALLRDANLANDALGLTLQLQGSNQTLQDCSNAGINNLKGRTTEQLPELSGQLGFDYHLEFASGFSIDTLADLVWNDEQFRQTDLDPASESGSFAKTNLALSFYRIGKPWKLSLVGRNIFDKKTVSYVNDTPLLDTTRQQIVDRPRTVKIQLEYDFQ
jgi:outer membrane receptor protein involved in Fe transport